MEARLLSLELEGFRSFKNKATFEFPEGDSVILIDGKWKDQPVSSGSGKTSVIEGLAFLLDISSSPATALKNWDSKKMRVKGTFRIGNSIVEATRDPKLSLIIDGKPYDGLAKGAKERLYEMLGGNDEIIKSITYRKQRKPGKIVNSTDSQIKEFLMNPLGLNEVDAAADMFTKQSNLVISEITLLKRDEANLSSTLPMNFVSDQDLATSLTAYTSAKDQYDKLAAPNSTNELQLEATQINAEIQNINLVGNNVQGKRNHNSSLRDTVVRLQAEIEDLKKNACPTCKREWDAAKDLMDKKNAEIDGHVAIIRVNAEYIKNSEPMLLELPNMQARLQDVQRKIGEASAPVSLAHTSAINAYNAYNGLVNKRKNYDQMAQRLAEAQSKVAAKERELLIAETSAKLLGRTGFMGSIFDEILTDIETRTNDMLQHFPNANQFTVQISSTKTVKTKGTTKKEISVGISRSGTDVGLDDISGGQQSAIELCSDLAAAEAVRSRSGCSLKWTCLDEVMDGLGSAEKEQVVNMIKNRVKGLVLMIEHATEIKESFDKVIGIEFDGKESYVTSR